MQNEASRAFQEGCRAYAGEWFERVRAMSEDGPGVTRLGYGEVELAVVNALEAEGRRLGLEVAYDKAGNCWMTLPGRDRTLPAFVSGSHADSVIWGGNYDGLAGILAPLSAVRWMVEQQVVSPRDFSVVVMRCEEQGCIGSTGWLGRVKPEDFDRRFKPGMPTLGEFMDARGVDRRAVSDGCPFRPLSAIGAFVELHIEQGPVLETSTVERIGLVSGIVGILMHRTVTVKGVRAHAGAVPYAFRHDALKAAAILVARLEAHWEALLREGKDLTYTVGVFNTPPKGAFNIIPGEVSFSVDIRSLDAGVRDAFGRIMKEEAEKIETERGVAVEFDAPVVLEPCLSNPDVFARLERAAAELGIPVRAMPSGAGHDAAVFGAAGIPVSMIFVANQHGSHTPEEAMELDDFVLGADLIRRTALDFE